MIPRLEAEESLLAARRTTIGSKSDITPTEFSRTQERWLRSANPDRVAPQPLKPTKKDLRSLGIGTRPWPKPPAPEVTS